MQKQLEILRKFFDKYFFIAFLGYFLFVAVFAITAKLTSEIKYLVKLDVIVQTLIIGLRTDSLTKALNIFTDLGDTKLMIFLTIAAVALLFLKKHYTYSIGIALSIGIAEIVSFVLKNAVNRHRPPEFINLVHESTASFPSGHTTAAISFYGFLIYFFYKNIKNKIWRNVLILICGIIILLAGFARIYIGAHWPSDVIASYILGGVWLWIIISIIKKINY